jgi:hypothetical protein
MNQTRREFATTFALLSGSLLGISGEPPGQKSSPPFPHPPPPADPQQRDKNDVGGPPNLQASAQARLALNEKQFRADVEKLWQFSSELRNEVQATSTSKVFSVSIYRKIAEIEKLARQLRGLAKNS